MTWLTERRHHGVFYTSIEIIVGHDALGQGAPDISVIVLILLPHILVLALDQRLKLVEVAHAASARLVVGHGSPT